MTEKTEEQTAPTFTKQQFLASKQFTAQEKDVVNAVLQDSESYSVAAAKKLVRDFLKKEAK